MKRSSLGEKIKMDDHETILMWIKNFLVWIGVVLTGITSSQILAWLTIALAASSLYLNILKIKDRNRAVQQGE